MIVFIDKIDPTPLGPIWAAESDLGLVAVEIGADRGRFVQVLNKRGLGQVLVAADRPAGALKQIEEYLQGRRRGFDLPIDWSVMTPFQQRVLRLVSQVPYGQTTTYGRIARQLGQPSAARAVGRANATNPIPLVIPCHRLVGEDGSLRGYGAPGGVVTKAWLLALEG